MTDLAERQRELAGMFAGRPVSIEPGVLDGILAETWAASGRGRLPPNAATTDDGVMVIAIHELIVPRPSWVTEIGWATALSDVRGAVDLAWYDKDVTAVVLHVDSPGGFTDGLAETADHLRAFRRRKPLLAVADTLMASAAYYLGSQASAVYATPSGAVGSIGVLTRHVDVSRALDAAGLTVSEVSAGRYKTELSPNAPLGAEARAHLQHQIDTLYGEFLEAVALGRGGGISPAEVKERYGQGRVLLAREALAAGMVDRIATYEQTMVAARSARPGTQASDWGSRSFAHEHEAFRRRSPREATQRTSVR